MSDNKKYYWLKLKRDFFKRHDIRIIESMPNGKDYILFYLKLLLESIDHEGELRFSDTIPYNEAMLATITDTNIDIVRSAMKLFLELNMIELFDDQTIFMPEVQKMIGSETNSAARVRKHRENQKALQCNTDETKCNTEIEKEKEKEIDLEREKERKNNQSLNQSQNDFSFSNVENSVENCTDSDQLKAVGGILGQGVVLLSENQLNDLMDKLSLDEFNKYIKIVAAAEIAGKHYKNKSHYRAILDMAMHDRQVSNIKG